MTIQARGYIFLYSFWLLLTASKIQREVTPIGKSGKQRTLLLALLVVATAFSRRTETLIDLMLYNTPEETHTSSEFK